MKVNLSFRNMSARFHENTVPQLYFSHFLWELKPRHLSFAHEYELSLLKDTFPATITAIYQEKLDLKLYL